VPDNDNILNIGRISGSRLHLQTMLDQVVKSAQEQLGADACALLLLDESKQTLTLKSSHGLWQSAVDAVRLPKGRGVSWRIVREKKPAALARAKDDPDFYFVPESGEENYTSMLGVPIIEEDECIGVMYVQSKQQTSYTDVDISRLEKISRQVAGAIKAAWDMDRVKEKARVYTKLNGASRLINATNNVDEIVRITANAASELIGARVKAVWVTDIDDKLKIMYFSESGSDPERLRPVCETIVTLATASMETINVADISADTRFEGLDIIAAASVVCCPMIFEERVLGAIVLADRITDSPDYFVAFTSEEIHILSAIAQTTAQAIDRARTHQRLEDTLKENEQNVRELSILFQLSMAMRRTLNLDDLLRVILSCVTVGHGLGFNRAILFLVDESVGVLQGMIGMGPDSAEHAGRIWSDLEEQPPDDLVPWLLDRDIFEVKNSQFNRMARSLQFPATGADASAIISKVIGQKVAVNIKGHNDLSQSDMALSAASGCEQFAMVPLVVRDTALGAVLVDNLYNSNPITDSDMELLTRFAAPAAWAIENMKLFEKWVAESEERLDLEKQMARVERMSTLGEVYAELAHELKNPLVSIGGFARRLISTSKSDKVSLKYASIIAGEVDRLETLLRNVLDLSKEVSIKRKESDLNFVVRDAVDFYSRILSGYGIKTRIDLDPDIDKVLIDTAWIKQVVINLILNAMEAMSCERHQTLRNLSIATENSGSGVTLRISDTGGGIADEDFHKVFNPFFTTKSQGTGLGLPLCKKMIQLHHGSMEIDNKLGHGVTFTINLPGVSGVSS